MYRIPKSTTLNLLRDSKTLDLSPKCVKLKKVPSSVSKSSLRYLLRSYDLDDVPNKGIREVRVKGRKVRSCLGAKRRAVKTILARVRGVSATSINDLTYSMLTRHFARRSSQEFSNYVLKFKSESEARQFARENGELVIDSRRVYVELYK